MNVRFQGGLSVTYADGFVLHRVLKDGFRSLALPASATNHASDVSFRGRVPDVSANRAITSYCASQRL
ncbi:hypothetical protein M2334_000254 [Sphingobium sp. B11D3D]|nr:hypothetical protein [Sphingobium sp. B11D3D]